MAEDERPILPRRVDDPDRVRLLREEALAKLAEQQRRDSIEAMDREWEREPVVERLPAPVYGGPPVWRDSEQGSEQEAEEREQRGREPAPVYGGPPVRSWWKLWR